VKKTLDKIEKMWYTVHYIVYDVEGFTGGIRYGS